MEVSTSPKFFSLQQTMWPLSPHPLPCILSVAQHIVWKKSPTPNLCFPWLDSSWGEELMDTCKIHLVALMDNSPVLSSGTFWGHISFFTYRHERTYLNGFCCSWVHGIGLASQGIQEEIHDKNPTTQKLPYNLPITFIERVECCVSESDGKATFSLKHPTLGKSKFRAGEGVCFSVSFCTALPCTHGLQSSKWLDAFWLMLEL